MRFAYRAAILVSGGLSLILADYFGWQATYEMMAGFILLSMIATLKAPKSLDLQPATSKVFDTIVSSLSDLLMRDKILWIFLFIIFYKFGDALALSLMTNFLLNGLGFTLTEVGLAYKTVSFAATILGAFVGGIYLIRLNIFRALLWFGLAQACSNLMFVVMALVGKQFVLMTVSIFIENFCSGLSTAALMAFLMSLCNQRYTAGQYAILSTIASLGRVFLGPLAGLLVKNLGWAQFYIWSFLLCFPGILFLLFLKDRVLEHAPATVE